MAKSVADLVKGMTFEEFLDVFGVIEDAETRVVDKLELWDAQRGFVNWLDGSWTKGLCLKARQLGISTIAGLYCIYMMLKVEGSQGLVISKDDDAAKYFLEFKVSSIYKKLPRIDGITWPAIVKDSANRFTISTGSFTGALPATGSGSAGYVASYVLSDEAGLVDGNNASKGGLAEVVTNVGATVEKSGGKVVYFGTAKRGSYFNKMVEKSIAGKMPSTEFFFLNAKSDPNRTDEWLEQEKELYPSEADFLSQFPQKPEDVLMSRDGLVFDMFDPMEGGGHVFANVKAELTLPTYFILDHGYSHPSVLLWCAYDITKDMVYVLGERRWEKTSVPEIARDIHAIKNKLPKIPETWLADSAIFNETGVNSVANVYREHGIKWSKTYKHNGLSLTDGSLGMLASRFMKHTVQISSVCKKLIWELSNWEWSVKRDGTDTNKPKDIHDDGIDCLRYLCAEVSRGYKGRESEATRQEDLDWTFKRGDGNSFGKLIQAKTIINKDEWIYM